MLLYPLEASEKNQKTEGNPLDLKTLFYSKLSDKPKGELFGKNKNYKKDSEYETSLKTIFYSNGFVKS